MIWIIFFLCSLVFAQGHLHTSRHASSYGHAIDRQQIDRYRCYTGDLQVPFWSEDLPGLIVDNDKDFPVSLSLAGRQVVVWRHDRVARRPLPDHIIVNNGLRDQERSVLNPEERCFLVLPHVPIIRGKWEWLVRTQLYVPVNPFGAYARDGIAGRVHTAEHRCQAADHDKVVISASSKRKQKNYRLSWRPFLDACQ